MLDIYDFIIVGGGSAGCVLARRLIDRMNVSVLLLEAGPKDWHPYIKMPAGFTKLTGETHSWGYETVPQTGLQNTKIWYPQGRVLGGGSSINAQVYTRGNKWDYDNWAAHGCDGWAYDQILPYFCKAEDNDRLSNKFHSSGGPLKVSDANPHKLTKAFVRAGQQAGLNFNSDFNGAEQQGVGFYQVTNREGQRCSAAAGYVHPIADDPRLDLRTKTLVTKIVIEKERAVSVEVVLNGDVRRVSARKEIIVTAGAIGSPKLLLLSGVGPREHLLSVGVDPILNLPGVGENLQDHMDVFCIGECSGDFSFDIYKKWHMAMWAGAQYLFFGSGPISSNVCDGGGFWFADESAPAPDIQFHFLPGSGLEHGLKKIKNGVTLNSALLRPKSRGFVKLRSNAPSEKPLINPNYWSEDADVKCSIAGFRKAREILSQPALRSFIKNEAMPGKDCISDDDIKEYAYKFAKTDYHPAGTCKMGSEEDPWSVVTPDLKVKNVEGLSVCDSSVMPFLVSSNTNAPTIMIAEKAADRLISEYNL